MSTYLGYEILNQTAFSLRELAPTWARIEIEYGSGYRDGANVGLPTMEFTGKAGVWPDHPDIPIEGTSWMTYYYDFFRARQDNGNEPFIVQWRGRYWLVDMVEKTLPISRTPAVDFDIYVPSDIRIRSTRVRGVTFNTDGSLEVPDITPPFDLLFWLKQTSGLFQESTKTTPSDANDEPVGAWENAAGNDDLDQLQATSEDRPSYQDGDVYFDGTQELHSATEVALKPVTVFLVMRPDTETEDRRKLIGSPESGGFSLDLSADGRLRMLQSGGDTIVETDPIIDDLAWVRVIATYDASGNYSILKNGVVVASGVNNKSIASDTVVLGGGLGDVQFTGFIREGGAYSTALSLSDCVKLDTYLSSLLGDIEAPTAPTAISLEGVSDTVLTFTHAADSTDNVGVTGYEVRLALDPSGEWQTPVDIALVVPSAVTALAADANHQAQGRAYDAAGNRSEWSNIVYGASLEAAFNPANVADMEFHWEAELDELANDASFVQLTDRTSNAAHATQGTGANRATNKTNILNGLAVARFDGSNDFYNFSLPSMTEFTMIAVKKTTSGGVLINGADAANDYWQLNTGDYDNFRADGVDAAVATDASEFEVHTWTFSSGSLKYYRNGVLTNTNSRTITAFQPKYLGCYNGSSDFIGADLVSLSIASRDLTGDDLDACHTYILGKTGL